MVRVTTDIKQVPPFITESKLASLTKSTSVMRSYDAFRLIISCQLIVPSSCGRIKMKNYFSFQFQGKLSIWMTLFQMGSKNFFFFNSLPDHSQITDFSFAFIIEMLLFLGFIVTVCGSAITIMSALRWDNLLYLFLAHIKTRVPSLSRKLIFLFSWLFHGSPRTKKRISTTFLLIAYINFQQLWHQKPSNMAWSKK